jgi:hypothetical protein
VRHVFAKIKHADELKEMMDVQVPLNPIALN